MDTQNHEREIAQLAQVLGTAEAVVVGVGGNTPGIIKYPFWRLVNANPQATYASINLDWVWAPSEIRERTILIGDDIDTALRELCAMGGGD